MLESNLFLILVNDHFFKEFPLFFVINSNILFLMADKKILPESYQHQLETRTSNEVELTNRIAKILS